MKRKYWPLAALAALFFGPFLVAVLLYAGRDHLGGFALVDNPDRELIENLQAIPVQPLALHDGTTSDPAWARSRWNLIYARISPCGEDCQAALTRLRQVWLTLGRDRDRVQLIFLIPGSGLPVQTPADFLTGVLDAPDGPELERLLGPERLEEGRYFVIDPQGYIMMSFPDDADQGRLQGDLERLLDVSQVG
jgi:hypothetical protein